jgi:predicted helicase
MIRFYNAEVVRFDNAHPGLEKKERARRIDDFIDTDATKISWTRTLKGGVAKGSVLEFDPAWIQPSLYRPFAKQWLYFDRRLIEYVFQMPRIFPVEAAQNRVIMVKQRWSGSGHFALLTDTVPEQQIDGGAQCFPLHVYAAREDRVSDNEASKSQSDLFAAPSIAPVEAARRDGITDAGLAHFHSAHPSESITKEDVFYYVYGILHSADYRERYADNLGKELPRIPRTKTAADFWAFSRAGRELGELHVGYERVPEYAATVESVVKAPSAVHYRVEKMRFGKNRRDGGGTDKDKTVVHYNDHFVVREIPLEAYEYVVNGKPAIEWVMERQSVTTDKDSGIVKDANAWATETVGDARYPLSLLLRVITVSLETNRIVRALPALQILEE